MGTGMHLASHNIETGALLFSIIDLIQHHCVQINKWINTCKLILL